jgi:hypothetical protein
LATRANHYGPEAIDYGAHTIAKTLTFGLARFLPSIKLDSSVTNTITITTTANSPAYLISRALK